MSPRYQFRPVGLSRPPRAYEVFDSPNEDENNTLCCPHESCDGMVFDNAIQCHRHDREWHWEPYCCTTCGAHFKVQTLLVRHAKLEGHEQKFVCRDEGCVFEGIHFGTEQSFRFHERELHCVVPGVDEAEAGDMDMDRILNNMCDKENIPPRSSPDIELYTCDAACCTKYQCSFRGKAPIEQHTRSCGHIFAHELDNELRQTILSDIDLEVYRLKARALTCFKTNCPDIGRSFSSTNAYRNHMNGPKHTGYVVYRTENKEDTEMGQTRNADIDTSSLSSITTVEEEPYSCDVPCCSRYRHNLGGEGALESHKKTCAHVLGMELDRQLRNSVVSTANLQAYRKKARELRCFNMDCPEFDHKFSAPYWYRSHLNSSKHGGFAALRSPVDVPHQRAALPMTPQPSPIAPRRPSSNPAATIPMTPETPSKSTARVEADSDFVQERNDLALRVEALEKELVVLRRTLLGTVDNVDLLIDLMDLSN